MKKLITLLLLFCFLSPFAFAQTTDELTEAEKEELKKEMKKLGEDLKITFENLDIDMKDLDIDMKNLDIDLSGLDQLKNINWENHIDEEDFTYLKSDEFKQEMKKVEEEVSKAMKEVRIEMEALENIDWQEINKSIEEAMEQMEKELSKINKEE